jgi:DNA-binding NarL/FixJ family response regulator
MVDWFALGRGVAASVADSRKAWPHCIRVLVVDDHAAVRHAIASVFEVLLDLELAGEASDVQEALQLCTQTRPDVILMDISLPGVSSADAIRAVLDCCPSSRVIATCTFQEEELIPEALGAGAVSYLLKNVSLDALASAIRAAYASPPMDGQAFSHTQGRAKRPHVDHKARHMHSAAAHCSGRRTI